MPHATVLTLHDDRVDKLVEYYGDFPDVAYVAISERQASLVPELGIRHVGRLRQARQELE